MSICLKLRPQDVHSIECRTQINKLHTEQMKQKQSTLLWEKVNVEDKTSDCTPKKSQESDSEEYKSMKPRDRIVQFRLSTKNDEHRHVLAHKEGGMTCDDPKQIDKLRSVGKEMIKLVGRKILSGEFNLTKISIPLKSCYPKTALYNSVKAYSIFPHFLNTAADLNDPLERFKLVVTSLICQPYYLNMFLKPLNPILGETLQARLEDGTELYAEQISHHPPISYFLIVGPNNSYQFSGYYDVEVSPGMNSLTIKNKGKRKFTFKDGTEILSTCNTNEFSGTFFGTSRIEELDTFLVHDIKHDLKCEVKMGNQKKKPSDYFKTQILSKGDSVATMSGTCLGFIQINGKRYWDGRELPNFELDFGEKWERLPSDWSGREDLQLLEKGDLTEGQLAKEKLENFQRSDAKLRKKYGSKKSQE